MSEWTYPDIIEKLRLSCAEFLDGKLSVTEIQSEIYCAENVILAIDEKWLRQMLFDAENEIELLTFTVDDEQLISSVIPIVQNIMNQISSK